MLILYYTFWQFKTTTPTSAEISHFAKNYFVAHFLRSGKNSSPSVTVFVVEFFAAIFVTIFFLLFSFMFSVSTPHSLVIFSPFSFFFHPFSFRFSLTPVFHLPKTPSPPLKRNNVLERPLSDTTR